MSLPFHSSLGRLLTVIATPFAVFIVAGEPGHKNRVDKHILIGCKKWEVLDSREDICAGNYGNLVTGGTQLDSSPQIVVPFFDSVLPLDIRDSERDTRPCDE